MNTAEILRAARALIEKPEAWTQGRYCLDANGAVLSYGEQGGVKWCAAGALGAVNGGECPEEAWDLLQAAGGHWSVTGFNDNPDRTHAEVLAAFDKAIAIAEASHE